MIKRFLAKFGYHKSLIHKHLPHTYRPLSNEDSAAILTLAHHPGFKALMKLLERQQDELRERLITSRLEIRDVDSLQAGIAWLGYFKNELHRRIERDEAPSRKAAKNGLDEEFRNALSRIDKIGPQGS